MRIFMNNKRLSQHNNGANKVIYLEHTTGNIK